MNKLISFKYILLVLLLGVIGVASLTGKTTWSLYDEEGAPKMLSCTFHGFWSKTLGIRIVINQSCVGDLK